MNPVETVEQARQVFCFDAFAGITHRQRYRIRLTGKGYRDLGAGCAMAYGIGKQIRNQFADGFIPFIQ